MNSSLFIRRIEIIHPKENEYPFNMPIIHNFEALSFKKPVTFLIGENGSGKSTLIEAIAIKYGFNPEGGSKNFTFSTKATHSSLHKHMKLVKGDIAKDGFFLRAESFYNVASNIDELGVENYYGGESLHIMSHGESFLELIKNRFFGNGLYILDEPEAALSPSSQLALLALINDLVDNNSQFIIATHSPILLGFPDCDIYEMKNDEIKKIKYQETENYFLTKTFLNNPDLIIKELFK